MNEDHTGTKNIDEWCGKCGSISLGNSEMEGSREPSFLVKWKNKVMNQNSITPLAAADHSTLCNVPA